MKRIFLFVLDSFGIGALPDAEQYGDKECNTLSTICTDPDFYAENMKKWVKCK